MPIKATITADEHAALADAMKAIYTKAADGSYRLDAEGVEDVTGLKSALGAERQKAKAAEDLAKELQGKFKDVDVEAYKKWLVDSESNVELKLIKDGKIEEVISRRTEKMRRDHEAEVAALKTENQKLTDGVTAITNELGSSLISAGISSVAPKLGVKPTAIDDLTTRAHRVWKPEKGEDGKLRLTPYRDGAIYYGKSGGKPIGFDEWIASLTSDAPHLFAENRGAGTPGSGSATVTGTGVRITRTEARNPESYKAAKARAEEAHVPLEIVEG